MYYCCKHLHLSCVLINLLTELTPLDQLYVVINDDIDDDDDDDALSINQ